MPHVRSYTGEKPLILFCCRFTFCAKFAITFCGDTILVKYVDHLLPGNKPSLTYENMYIQARCQGSAYNTLKIGQYIPEGAIKE